jgi:hypothetical protein
VGHIACRRCVVNSNTSLHGESERNRPRGKRKKDIEGRIILKLILIFAKNLNGTDHAIRKEKTLLAG